MRFIKKVLSKDRPLRFLLGYVLVKTRLCKLYTIRLDEVSIRFHPAHIPLYLWVYGAESRAGETAFPRAYLRNDDVVIDVGANVGTFTLPTARIIGPNGRIIAIEPHPRIFSYLAENVCLNRATNVFLINSLVGKCNEVVGFDDRFADDQNAVNINSAMAVQTQTLDQIAAAESRIALLKIDVEGYELFVLQGGERTLKRSQCVYFEVYQDAIRSFGYVLEDLISTVERCGFLVFQMQDHQRLVRFRKSSTLHSQCENMIAIRDTKDFITRTGWTIFD